MLRLRHHRLRTEHFSETVSWRPIRAYTVFLPAIVERPSRHKYPDIHHRTQKGHTLEGRLRQFYKTYINKA